MKLNHPFFISSRLAPALSVGGAIISFDSGRFVIDLPDGAEHVVTGFRFPPGYGVPEGRLLVEAFGALLSFLSACAESRAYAQRTGREGENADLFPETVGAWAESCSDELGLLCIELEETPDLITR